MKAPQFLASLLLFASISFADVAADRAADSTALLAIMKANPDSWFHDNWVPTQPMENWKYVTLTNGRVTELQLVNKELEILPAEIGKNSWMMQ